jgi:signal transduction histidine kinase
MASPPDRSAAADLPPALRFLDGGGEATRLILARDWAGHPLGEPSTWPEALKVSLSLILNSPESMVLSWGREDLTFFFNTTYIPLLGPRAAWAMGAPFTEVWADGWEQAKPIIEDAFAGRAERFIDLPWKLDTDRGACDTWWSFSYSRVLDGQGEIAGLFIFTNETTARVLADAAARDGQEALRRETERQRLSLQQMPGFVAILSGPDHVFDYVNDAYVAMVGQRQFLGHSVRQVFPELESQGFYELLDQVYASGEPFSARGLPVRLAGEATERYIDFLFQPICDDAGQVSGIFAGGYDITDQVRIEKRREALLALDRRLGNLADPGELSFAASALLGEALGVIRVGYGAIDPENETITVVRNWSAPGISSVAGVHRFRDYGKYHADLRRGEVVANADVALDARTAGNVEAFRILGIQACLDVPVVEEGHTVAQLFVHSATPRAWTADEIAFVRDVAERTRAAIARREAEAHSRASEARLANAIASAQLGTFEWDPVSGTIDLDAQARAIYGLPPEGPVHQDEIFTRIPADQAEPIRERALLLAGRGEQMDFAYDINLADGTTRFVRSSCVAIPTPAGQRYVGVFQDATEVKAAERSLRSIAETLEERVHERTAALEAAHEQLRQSQKMEAVGQLTGGLAHDFNNLLAGITGSLELIRMRMAQGRSADVEKYVTAAQGAANRAAALTHRLLAFSRRQTLAPKPTDVKQLVAGMADLIGRTVGPQITLETVNAVGLWPSLIDPSQLENAILNLCINARDAMPHGGTITIETANRWLDRRMAQERGLEPGHYISLCVSDTGTGMTADVIAKAFDPFFTTKPIGVGTGLGLSMIYGFAKQSGGVVSIDSELGKGTNVCIYLPRHLGAAEEAGVMTELTDAPRGEGETVLIVDDEPTVRMLVSEVLADLGYTAIEAEDGPAGLKALQSSARIDLLVTDVGLPGGMNGRQVADAARVVRPNLKVLFITGYAENAVLSHGHLDPGMHVMTKPFAMEALASRIRELIET